MEPYKIEELVNKYEEGNTSIKEEQTLRDYFTTGDVPPHLQSYKMIFGFTSKARLESYPGTIKLKSRKFSLAMVGIAASIILAVGIFTTLNMVQDNTDQQNIATNLGTIEDPEEAYLKAKETLQMVSEVLNNGQEGLTYVEEFDKNKNKYLKQ